MYVCMFNINVWKVNKKATGIKENLDPSEKKQAGEKPLLTLVQWKQRNWKPGLSGGPRGL